MSAASLQSFDNHHTAPGAVEASQPAVFTDIYQKETNIAIWRRELPTTLQASVKDLLTSRKNYKAVMTVSPQSTRESINESLGTSELPELSENISELVDMFCCLFDLKRTGLRLSALDKAMCPRFHVDRVPCRLVTTYVGAATQWLPHDTVDRTKLGAGNNGLPDDKSGIYRSEQDIQQLSSGDVALLKGEAWLGNENAGLVHRSPAPLNGENRLLLTLDFMD